MVLVFALLVVPVTFVMGAVAVDVSLWQSERRGAQKDADLAALAGAVELMLNPGDHAAAADVAREYGDTNDEASNSPTLPDAILAGDHGVYVTDTCVTVNLRHESRTFFMDIFGLSVAPDIGAHAKACVDSESFWDIYAHHSDCPTNAGITISGNGGNIRASMHSEGDISFPGNSNTIAGTAEYVCDVGSMGNNNQITDGPNPAASIDWPIYFEYADFNCNDTPDQPDVFVVTAPINESTPQFWLNNNPSTNTLKPGTYCSPDGVDIVINRSGGSCSLNGRPSVQVCGNVTLVSGNKIDLRGNSYDLEAYEQGVVLFADPPNGSGSNAIRFSGNAATFTGIIFTEFGQISLTGNTLTFHEGGMLGDTITIVSNGDVAFYDSVIAGKKSVVLVE